MNTNMNANTMDAICTPILEPNFEMLEAYESMHYDELNHITFAPQKLTRSYHANEVYGCGRTGAEIMAQNEVKNEVTQKNEETNDKFEGTIIDDLLINIKSAFPFLNLKDIAGQISRIYSDSETLESFVPGQRIGDYEYMTIETNYCIILFGRVFDRCDDYATIHYWLK